MGSVGLGCVAHTSLDCEGIAEGPDGLEGTSFHLPGDTVWNRFRIYRHGDCRLGLHTHTSLAYEAIRGGPGWMFHSSGVQHTFLRQREGLHGWGLWGFDPVVLMTIPKNAGDMAPRIAAPARA